MAVEILLLVKVTSKTLASLQQLVRIDRLDRPGRGAWADSMVTPSVGSSVGERARSCARLMVSSTGSGGGVLVMVVMLVVSSEPISNVLIEHHGLVACTVGKARSALTLG